MRQPRGGAESGGAADKTRDQAFTALLLLGDRLRSVYSGQEAQPPTSKTSTAIAADSLVRAIETEIIPRLMLVHSESSAGDAQPRKTSILVAADHEQFLGRLLHGSAAATREFVDGLLERGVSRETVFLDLLGQAARRLGELWEEDLCDFADVTIGLCRLHETLREHSILNDPSCAPGHFAGPSILLATACADQHVFGVVLVAEFFRRDGWRVWSEPGTARNQIAAILARDPFDVVGLSAACDANSEQIGSEIETYRKASRNRAIRVLVGGRLFAESPDLVNLVGADGAATDARSAPTTGSALLAAIEADRP